MGRAFGHFTADPHVLRCAAKADEARNACIAGAISWLARCLMPSRGVGRG
jgi:hypothetical protein